MVVLALDLGRHLRIVGAGGQLSELEKIVRPGDECLPGVDIAAQALSAARYLLRVLLVRPEVRIARLFVERL